MNDETQAKTQPATAPGTDLKATPLSGKAQKTKTDPRKGKWCAEYQPSGGDYSNLIEPGDDEAAARTAFSDHSGGGPGDTYRLWKPNGESQTCTIPQPIPEAKRTAKLEVRSHEWRSGPDSGTGFTVEVDDTEAAVDKKFRELYASSKPGTVLRVTGLNGGTHSTTVPKS